MAGETMLRIDADSMHDAADFHDALGRFGRGEVKLLVGTQMIAKGLDFPGVRLVGVVNADTALNLPDFRAAERTFQLVSQVSGRCGRGADAGRAIVQTFQPEAPAIKLAAAHDFEAFAAEELALRAKFGLPPWRRMARVVVRDADEEKARELAEALAREIAAFPQGCLRADRASSRSQWELSDGAALAQEFARGLQVLRSGEAAQGAARFVGGAGRGGRPAS
jgi:primosomal protein N' (replication factor Y)